MSGKKVALRVKVRVFRSHDEHQYPEVPFLWPGEMSGISQICTITLVFRLAAPEFHLTACRAAGSPAMTAPTKWRESVTADWYLPLHLISIQHCWTGLATAFIADIPWLSSSPRTWFLWLERIWNAAISEILLARSQLWTKTSSTGDRRKHSAQSIPTRVIYTEG